MEKQTLSLIKCAKNVQELMDELSHMPPEAYVFFTCDYGDHSHTTQALQVEKVEELDYEFNTIAESAYSQSKLAVEEFLSDDSGDEPVGDPLPENVKVVILS